MVCMQPQHMCGTCHQKKPVARHDEAACLLPFMAAARGLWLHPCHDCCGPPRPARRRARVAMQCTCGTVKKAGPGPAWGSPCGAWLGPCMRPPGLRAQGACSGHRGCSRTEVVPLRAVRLSSIRGAFIGSMQGMHGQPVAFRTSLLHNCNCLQRDLFGCFHSGQFLLLAR